MAEEKLIRNPKLIIGEAEKVEAEVVGADDIVVVTDEEFYTAKEVDDLLKKSGSKLPILTHMFSDHIINDVSWLRADTFSWHSGDVYISAYGHLAEDVEVVSYIVSLNSTYYRTPSDDVVINGTQYYAWTTEFGGVLLTTSATPQTSDSVYNRDGTVNVGGIQNFVTYIKGAQTETIGDITISYSLADDGHKICLPDQESNIVALYEKTGAADYYILDTTTTNKRFKLPRKQKRTLIQAVKNTDGTWYNLYSDGWVEQGGRGQTNVSVTLPIAMTDSNYVVLVENHVRVNGGTGASNMTTTSFIPRWQQHNANAWGSGNFAVSWQVSGYAAESAYASAGMRLEYYYVGNFEQDAVEQTAGLNAELFNGKADRNLLNTTDNVDIVVESQLPTEANGYIWYRKYKSGWVEQGGQTSGSTASITITFPVVMANANYTAVLGNRSGVYEQLVITSRSITNMVVKTTVGTGSASCFWQVSGMSAQ